MVLNQLIQIIYTMKAVYYVAFIFIITKFRAKIYLLLKLVYVSLINNKLQFLYG